MFFSDTKYSFFENAVAKTRFKDYKFEHIKGIRRKLSDDLLVMMHRGKRFDSMSIALNAIYIFDILIHIYDWLLHCQEAVYTVIKITILAV